MSGQFVPLAAGMDPVPTHPPSRLTGPGEDSDFPHRPVGPDGALCACGGPRETCVRDAVRTVWTAQTPVEEVDRGLPERHPDDRMTVLVHRTR